MRVYCDTCLYLDIFEGRKDRFRDLAEFALQIFRRVREGEFTLIISDWLLYELTKFADKDVIHKFLNGFFIEKKVIIVHTSSEDWTAAKALSPHNFQDTLHAVLAHNAKADYLLTRNIKDYAGCEHLVKIELPESI